MTINLGKYYHQLLQAAYSFVRQLVQQCLYLPLRQDKYEYSVSDSTQLQKYLVSLCDLTDTQKVLYDIDKNGELTITDATNIQKIVVGLTSDIPSENPNFLQLLNQQQ